MSVSIFSCTPAAPAKRRSAKKGGAESAKKAGAKAGFAETDPAKLTAAASEAQAQAETAVKPEKKRASVLDQVAEKLPATASTITNLRMRWRSTPGAAKTDRRKVGHKDWMIF